MSSDTVRLINLTDATVLDEEELLDRARQGDKSAFGALYLRHKDAARKVAGMAASSAADAEDAVAEGFARVFAALPRMDGRNIAFRPYLLTCVRNAATDRLRRERRIDLRDEMPDTPGLLQADDVAILGLERNLVGEALQALPDRWRTVLWLTEVEGLSPAEVSRRIGIKPNAVAALAYRARKGLREAYLQAHLRAEASQECRSTVSRLGNYVRAELSERERLAVQTHLDACAKCRCRRDELTDVNATLRHALLPVTLLLAGVQRKWFSLTQISELWSRSTELGLAQAIDTPLTQKALAGISVVALAIGGTALPKLADGNKTEVASPPAASAAAAPEASNTTALTVEPATPIPLELMVSPLARGSSRVPGVTTAAQPAVPGGAEAAPPATPVEAAAEPASAHPAVGGTRSRLLPGFGHGGDGSRSDSPNRKGDTRQHIIDHPGTVDDGPFAGTPVQTVLDTALDAVDALLPVDVAVDLPPVVGLTTEGGSPDAGSVSVDLHEGVGLDLAPLLGGALPGPEASAETPAGAAEPAAGLLGQVDGLLSGVTGLLGDLLR